MRGVLFSVLLCVSLCASMAAADDARVSKLEEIQALLAMTNVEHEESFLFGKLVKEKDGYRFSEFGTVAVPEQPWVNLHALEPAWDVRERSCGKRLLGRNSCPKSSKALFRSSRTHIGSTVWVGLMTVGIFPIIGEVSASTRFHEERFETALAEAVERLEISEGQPLDALLADYDRVWRGLNAYRSEIEDRIAAADISVDVNSGLPGEVLRLSPAHLVSVRGKFAWMPEDGLVEQTPPALTQVLDTFLARTGGGGVSDDLVSVMLECPGAALEIQIAALDCDLSHQWDGKDLTVDGLVSITSWKRLILPSLAFEISNDDFRVEFGGGLMVIYNLSDAPLTVSNITVVMRGKNISKAVSPHRIAPGGFTYYGGLITDGDMRRVMSSATTLDAAALDTAIEYGAILRYSGVGPGLLGKTATLTTQSPLSEVIASNVAYLNQKGALLVEMDQTISELKKLAFLTRLARLAELQRERGGQ